MTNRIPPPGQMIPPPKIIGDVVDKAKRGVGGAVSNAVGQLIPDTTGSFVADLVGNLIIGAAGVGLVVFGARRMFGG